MFWQYMHPLLIFYVYISSKISSTNLRLSDQTKYCLFSSRKIRWHALQKFPPYSLSSFRFRSLFLQVLRQPLWDSNLHISSWTSLFLHQIVQCNKSLQSSLQDDSSECHKNGFWMRKIGTLEICYVKLPICLVKRSLGLHYSDIPRCWPFIS